MRIATNSPKFFANIHNEAGDQVICVAECACQARQLNVCMK